MHQPLVLHSSPTRLALSASTPVLLLGLGVVGLVDRVSIVPVVLTGLGLVLLAVVLFDLPVSTTFDREGFERRCPLRRERVTWDRVVAIERTASGRRRRRAPRTGGDPETGSRRAPGRSQGLTARVGPRRVVLLVDRRESHAEYVELRTLLSAVVTQLRAAEPPLQSAPAGRGATALHRRTD